MKNIIHLNEIKVECIDSNTSTFELTAGRIVMHAFYEFNPRAGLIYFEFEDEYSESANEIFGFSYSKDNDTIVRDMKNCFAAYLVGAGKISLR